MSTEVKIIPQGFDEGTHRMVPVLADYDIGHYPEFRDFLVMAFGLETEPLRAPGLLDVGGRGYALVFVGRSGQPFPSGVEVNALVVGLEPLNEDRCDADVWAILRWLVAGVEKEWSVDELDKTGRIYRIPAAVDHVG